jgi:hypothetical protein
MKMVYETNELKEEGEGAEGNGNYKEVEKGHCKCGHTVH